jgi:hypothetical protein
VPFHSDHTAESVRGHATFVDEPIERAWLHAEIVRNFGGTHPAIRFIHHGAKVRETAN